MKWESAAPRPSHPPCLAYANQPGALSKFLKESPTSDMSKYIKRNIAMVDGCWMNGLFLPKAILKPYRVGIENVVIVNCKMKDDISYLNTHPNSQVESCSTFRNFIFCNLSHLLENSQYKKYLSPLGLCWILQFTVKISIPSSRPTRLGGGEGQLRS